MVLQQSPYALPSQYSMEDAKKSGSLDFRCVLNISHSWGGESIGNNDVDGGDGVGGKNVYNGKTEPALVSVSDSYSEDEIISICNEGPLQVLPT